MNHQNNGSLPVGLTSGFFSDKQLYTLAGIGWHRGDMRHQVIDCLEAFRIVLGPVLSKQVASLKEAEEDYGRGDQRTFPVEHGVSPEFS
jgi:hypothetical protein